MAPSKPMSRPSLEMLCALTDENVLRALMAESRLTRAEIAARTGISKPTISDSVQRLVRAGLVVDTGERTTGRGRVGSYHGIAPGLGAALVVGITPHGVTAEAVDALGSVRARQETGLGRDAGPQAVGDALGSAVRRLAERTEGGLRTGVVSAADPVDRTTGRLVHLPDAPFLVGDLDPPAVLAPYVTGPLLVDNDVNWAARAERTDGRARGVDDFVYLHLGEGLGGAVVSDGEVRRGHHGFAGEIAHLCVPGPDGTALALTEVFAALGLRRPGSTAVDVAALHARLAADDARAEHTRTVLADAIGAVLAAAVAFADPRTVVLGGSWGPALAPAVDDRFRRSPRPVPVTAATLTGPELTGARAHAVDTLRTLVVRSAHPTLDP
ncbi:ROK family protein [Streptomyces sp. SID8379]|uniref:ROK family transcriptional regulator n=1 Tax=unclassified Streptomyces TaxID=2593676 RepID=UPI00035D27E8|nr:MULTISPECIES: ROK family transcriptional regulator [unclassified Streptomyces]MYW70066.1 ROK family protein [Streptomyces sp. SID8379]